MINNDSPGEPPKADCPYRPTVRTESKDSTASDTITFIVTHDGAYEPPPRIGGGRDRDAVGAWPDKHVLGMQLGPNRNGGNW